MAVFRVNTNKDYTNMANFHFRDKTLSWKAKGILSNMLSLPDDWDYSLAGLATLASDGMSATRSAIKELEEHGYLIRKPIRENGRISDWEYIIFENPQQTNQFVENQVVENQQVENEQLENHTQLNTKELSTNKLSTKQLNTKEKKKERKTTGYDEILSMITDYDLKELYLEYIKMRKLIKSPMTDRALTMLINKVNELEPISIDRQKQLLETAIMNNWKSVYPLKDNKPNNYTKNQKQEQGSGNIFLDMMIEEGYVNE